MKSGHRVERLATLFGTDRGDHAIGSHLCMIMSERGWQQTFLKLDCPHLCQLCVLKRSAVLSTKTGAVVFLYFNEEGNARFKTGAVLHMGECDYEPGPHHLSQKLSSVSGGTMCYVTQRTYGIIQPTWAQMQSLLPSFTSPHHNSPVSMPRCLWESC